jgi:hypothetical protein
LVAKNEKTEGCRFKCQWNDCWTIVRCSYARSYEKL